MKRILAALILFGATSLAAQQENLDPIEANLFPPELVMQNRTQLGLTDSQRGIITEAVRELQNAVLDLEWDMQDAQQELVRLLSVSTIDLEAARDALTRMLDIEKNVKLAHITALVTIKNALNADQKETLARLRQQR